jgi:thiamine-phosphate diphosphorylase
VTGVPRLHVVTDDLVLSRGDFLPIARALLEAGGEALAFHVRGPTTDGRRLYELVRELIEFDESGARVFVNDRVDVALAARAAGVHLGRRSLSVERARALVGSASIVGLSVHEAGEAAEAKKNGADYAFVGTLFPTPTHPGHVGDGPRLLTEVAEVAKGLTLCGIGGVTPERVAAVVRAGGHGVAVIRGIWSADDPTCALHEYLSALGDTT